MSNSFTPIVEQVVSTPAQTAPQPLPLDADFLKLIGGGADQIANLGPAGTW